MPFLDMTFGGSVQIPSVWESKHRSYIAVIFSKAKETACDVNGTIADDDFEIDACCILIEQHMTTFDTTLPHPKISLGIRSLFNMRIIIFSDVRCKVDAKAAHDHMKMHGKKLDSSLTDCDFVSKDNLGLVNINSLPITPLTGMSIDVWRESAQVKAICPQQPLTV